MKNLITSFRFTIVACVFLSVCYVSVLWLFGQVFNSNGGNAEVVELNGKVVGAANVGQNFTEDIYFWGRPSHAGENGYDATSSCGSNMGPSNPAHHTTVNARVDSFLVHHPYLTRKDIPAEMVTASASGLDPDITPECAYIQVKRVADARHLQEAEVRKVVESHIEGPLFGFLGTAKVNVLKLNVALDKLHTRALLTENR